MSWKSLFSSGELTDLPKELTDLLGQSKRDSKALRELLKRSETAAKKFERLVDPLRGHAGHGQVPQCADVRVTGAG